MTAPRRLSAPWIYPVLGDPIRDGAVLIEENGRVAMAGPDTSVPAPAECHRQHFPTAAIMPGLINTHTHLELTGFAGHVPEDDFAAWIRHLRTLKEERSPEQFLEAAHRGVGDCFASGVTTVADTGDSGAVIQAMAELGASGIVYQEVFGPHPDQCNASLAGLRSRIADLRRFESPRIQLGVSPHAPFTVSEALFREVTELARREDLPVAVHIAESPAEAEFLLRGTGAFADAWRGRQIPLPLRRGRSPIAWLDASDVLGPSTLCIHAVQVDASDIALLARRRCAIAHCPGSNLRHGHGDAPLAALLAAGLRVGVGTDSVASVGRLDLLAEARRARRLADLNAKAALALCTLEAARALGLEHEVGHVTAGGWGDVTVFEIGDVPTEGALAEALLERVPEDVVATYVSGRKVYARDGSAR